MKKLFNTILKKYKLRDYYLTVYERQETKNDILKLVTDSSGKCLRELKDKDLIKLYNTIK